jgi:hypothetical protein
MIAAAAYQGPRRPFILGTSGKDFTSGYQRPLELGECRIGHHRKEEGILSRTVSRWPRPGQYLGSYTEPKWGWQEETRISGRTGPEATQL